MKDTGVEICLQPTDGPLIVTVLDTRPKHEYTESEKFITLIHRMVDDPNMDHYRLYHVLAELQIAIAAVKMAISDGAEPGCIGLT